MDTEDLIFGYTPKELGLDPITREFINCDRMVERNDVNDKETANQESCTGIEDN